MYGYSYLVHRIQEHERQGDGEDIAIGKAVDECLDAGILTNFRKKNGKEVIQMFKLQWNEKDAKKYWMEEAEAKGHAKGKMEGKAEGMAEGKAEGKAEGIAMATVKIVRNLLSSGKLSYKEIAENADTSLDEVIRIAKESHLAY